MAERDIVRPQGVVLNRRKYGVFRWGLLVSAMLVVLVVVVLTAVLLIDDDNTTLVLIVLVLTLVIVGFSACMFLEWLHRRAMRRRDEGAKAWINRTLSENQLEIAHDPTPPPESNAPSLTPRSSWIHWVPWRRSGTPSSRSTGTPSSRSTAPPTYSMVERNGRLY